jgi:hypothetical protein
MTFITVPTGSALLVLMVQPQMSVPFRKAGCSSGGVGWAVLSSDTGDGESQTSAGLRARACAGPVSSSLACLQSIYCSAAAAYHDPDGRTPPSVCVCVYSCVCVCVFVCVCVCACLCVLTAKMLSQHQRDGERAE